MKECTRCRVEKDLDAFSPDRRNRDGRQARCKDCRKLAQGERYRANPAQALAYYRVYAVANASVLRERAVSRLAREKAEHPDRVRARAANGNHRWRMKRHATVIGKLTASQWRDTLAYFGNRCAYCLAQGKMEQDHIIPLSQGGTHTAENVVPACRSCNARKSNRPLWEAVNAFNTV